MNNKAQETEQNELLQDTFCYMVAEVYIIKVKCQLVKDYI